MSAVPLLAVDNLRQSAPVFGQKTPRTIFESVTLALAPGESVAILGRDANGAGSLRAASALARAIALIDRPAGGHVRLSGADVTRARGGQLRALRRALQYVGGDPRRALSPRLTVLAILAEPLQVHGLGSPAAQRERIAAAAEAWGLNNYLLEARPESLSTALCLRIALARAYLLSPRIVVCDGPVEHLEPAAARPVIAGALALVRAAGAAWLWTTTDSLLARALSDRVLILEGGRLKEEG